MGERESQPWARETAQTQPDRAFFEALFDRWVREEREREQRLFNRLDWLILRWLLICLAIGVVLGLLYVIVTLGNGY